MKVLIATSTFATQSTKPLDLLKKAGFELVLNPHGRRLKSNEVIEMAQGVSGMIAGTERLDEEIFRKTPLLRVISRCGAGSDTLDLKAVHKRKIDLYTTPEAPVESVAELTLGLIIGTLRRVAEADRSMRQQNWKPLMGRLLFGKTVGLIGLGRIGRRMVELLAPFQVKILARERYPDKAFARRHKVRLTHLPDLLKRSDVVSLHITLDDETRNMIGADGLVKMKKTAVLINTARGELVDDGALAQALQQERLAGAGIDVFQPEPYQGPLIQCPTAILTSHMGSYAIETRVQMELQAARNLLKGLRKIKQ